jgi:hypothetical protein
LESVIVNDMGWSRPVRSIVLPDTVNAPLAVMFCPVGETEAGINMVNEPALKVIVQAGTWVKLYVPLGFELQAMSKIAAAKTAMTKNFPVFFIIVLLIVRPAFWASAEIFLS